MSQVFFHQISLSQVILYNIICLVGLLYIYRKSPKKGVSPLIIYLFAFGIFSDSTIILGTRTLFNLYKAIIFLWSVSLLIKYSKYIYEFKKPLFFLSLFATYFFAISFLFHKDNLSLVFSQLSKYLSPFFIAIAIFSEVKSEPSKKRKLHSLLFRLLLFQILLSIVKLFILGSFMEGWVGSITGIRGGGTGTSLPLLGLFWLLLVTNIKTTSQNVFFAIGLLLIGIMAGKRAVIVLMPLLYILIHVFLSSEFTKMRNIKYILPAFLIVLGMFYLGLRLTPSLNPEGKVWGSFDINYAYRYGLKYSTGIDDKEEGVQEGVGRVGGVLLFWNDIQSSRGGERAMFGLGNEYMAYADTDDYHNADYYLGVTSRGSITGIVYMYFSVGLIGIILLLLYLFSLYSIIEYKRLRYFLLFTVLFDFVFYNAQMIFSIPMFAFQLFIVILANYSFDKYGNFIFNSYKAKTN